MSLIKNNSSVVMSEYKFYLLRKNIIIVLDSTYKIINSRDSDNGYSREMERFFDKWQVKSFWPKRLDSIEISLAPPPTTGPLKT